MARRRLSADVREQVLPDEDHGIGFVFARTSAEIEPKTIVAYGLTFGCRLALFSPFSTLPVPVAARWHCTAPTTELRKAYSEFAPSRPRSFRQCQFSGDTGPVLNDFSCNDPTQG